MSALAPINMLWVRGELPWYAQMSIRSFVHHGHEVLLHTYEPPAAVPAGCIIEDAGDTLPAAAVFGYPDDGTAITGYLSGFANWFRYQLLLDRGGWWVDTDVICQRPFVAGDEYMFASTRNGGRDSTFVNNNVIYVERPGSDVLAKCVALCNDRRDRIFHAETGPLLLHAMVKELGRSRFVAHPRRFNPFEHHDIALLLWPRARLELLALSRTLRNLRPVFLRGSWGLHLFSVMARELPAMRSLETLPPNSFLARVIARNTGWVG